MVAEQFLVQGEGGVGDVDVDYGVGEESVRRRRGGLVRCAEGKRAMVSLLGNGSGERNCGLWVTYSCNGFSSCSLARGGASSLSCGSRPLPLVFSPAMTRMSVDSRAMRLCYIYGIGRVFKRRVRLRKAVRQRRLRR